MADQESPWKELLTQRLPGALAFLRPKWHADADWSHDHEPLEQELRQLLPEGQVGKRIADHLVKLMMKKGDPRYAHIEVQGRKERGFRRRMWQYNTRASDLFGLPAASLAILTDRDPKWRPRSYREQVWDTSKWFRFETVKVLDWAGKEEQLERDANPVALFVRAHLLGQASRKQPEDRARGKLRLLRLLGERKLEAAEQARWFRWFDWLLPLPKERNRRVWAEARQQAQEGIMPFVTVAEEFGREEGYKLGLDAGRKEGLDAGRKEGLDAGRKEGGRAYLLKGIALALELKFGSADAALLKDLDRHDLPVLEAVLNAVKAAAGPDDLRRLLPANGQVTSAPPGPG